MEQVVFNNQTADGQKVLILRGASGAGKSTFASKQKGYHITLEADQFFMKDGKYNFDFTKLKDAHEDCFKRFVKALNEGKNVIVANTNTKFWEMERYVKECIKRDIGFKIITLNGKFKNEHGVPEDKVQQMRDRMDSSEEINRQIEKIEKSMS